MPDWPKQIASLLAALNLAPAREAEIVEELSQHLSDRYNELATNGVTLSWSIYMCRQFVRQEGL